MKKVMLILVVLVMVSLAVGYALGQSAGWNAGTRQMARHILNPAFRTERFDAVVEEEKGDGERYDVIAEVIKQTEQWKQKARSWQYAAEHYGGICKWLIEGKPIYDPIVVGRNATLKDCLLITGNGIEINGDGATVMNCEFRVWDMDWIDSLAPVDPNEFDKEVMLLTKGD